MSSETVRQQDAIEQGQGIPTVYHIPVCPFSQRLEILLELKGLPEAVAFEVVDITKPRPESLPVLETGGGGILKESMVILQYLEDSLPQPPVAQRDPTATPSKAC